jgi:penicillin-binding protein-related factor A (putative recombinase)
MLEKKIYIQIKKWLEKQKKWKQEEGKTIDFIGLYKGVLVGIEIKLSNKSLNMFQKKLISDLKQKRGVVFIVDSLKDLKKCLKKC